VRVLSWRRVRTAVLLPVLSVVLGFVVGAAAILASRASPLDAYLALFQGAFTNTNALPETLVATIPYVFLGLAVALGFRAGLFNIGGQGQLALGGLFGAYVAYNLPWLPGLPHVILALVAGTIAGFLFGAIPGFLKARFGAHEVITTIMLNYVAALFVDLMVNRGPMSDRTRALPETPPIVASAQLPVVLPDTRLHAGLFLALLVVPVIWYLIERTTIGFRIRAVGLNASVARAAGMSVGRTMVTAMGISGGLAGLAGIIQVLGVDDIMTGGVLAGYGFDAIAVALVARSNPWAIVPAALLFGALRSGSSFMQLQTQVSSDLISVVQAAVIVFVAAPLLVRWLFRLREVPAATVSITAGGLGGAAPPGEGVA
jgi:general nucleoside transport system permease protein